ncbi:CIDEB [Cervus elaphus hippelaphus]|uniref:CIDEB n=1 Tax=Cervus elaphus hippelaphus TaxID=46360 RepID=A0A212CVE0_CEREH|nr:CIDEB [Cervus elaphus hippelaphus]
MAEESKQKTNLTFRAPPTPDFLLSLPCRELLRWASSLLQGLGHLLLGISSTLHRAVEGSERWQRQGRLKPY